MAAFVFDTHNIHTKHTGIYTQSLVAPNSVNVDEFKKVTEANFRAYGNIGTKLFHGDSITAEQYIEGKQRILHDRRMTDPEIVKVDAARMRANDELFAKNHTTPDGKMHISEIVMSETVALLKRQGHGTDSKELQTARGEWHEKRLALGLEKEHQHGVSPTTIVAAHSHSKSADKGHS